MEMPQFRLDWAGITEIKIDISILKSQLQSILSPKYNYFDII